MHVSTHRFWALLTTIFCFQIGGFIALYHSGRVAALEAQGDLAGAQGESRLALNWIWINVFVCLGFWACLFAMIFAWAIRAGLNG